MDQTLIFKKAEFQKALASLKQALAERENDIIRDSVIKRFEYTFELCWKNAKVYLSQKYGIDVFSPKEVFRELRKNGLLSDEETEILLQMVDDRNQIIHTYSQEFSQAVYQKIKADYYSLMEKVYGFLK